VSWLAWLGRYTHRNIHCRERGEGSALSRNDRGYSRQRFPKGMSLCRDVACMSLRQIHAQRAPKDTRTPPENCAHSRANRLVTTDRRFQQRERTFTRTNNITPPPDSSLWSSRTRHRGYSRCLDLRSAPHPGCDRSFYTPHR